MTKYDYVEFKSGLVIKKDSNLIQEYVTSLRGIDSEETFNGHKNKWRPIIKIESSYDDFLKYKDNPNLFAPSYLVKIDSVAIEYGVSSGDIIIQLLSALVFYIENDTLKGCGIDE